MIAVLGNSHIACLKAAYGTVYDIAPNAPQITFFGARGTHMAALNIHAATLYSQNPKVMQFLRHTSGGQSQIVLDDYHQIIICGLTRDVTRSFDSLPMTSAAVFDLALQGYWQSTGALALVKTIRGSSNIPIAIMHDPLWSKPHSRADSLTSCWYDAYLDATQHRVWDAWDVTALGQPRASRNNRCRTKARYAKAAPQLAVGKANDHATFGTQEFRHMNASFGALRLQQIAKLSII